MDKLEPLNIAMAFDSEYAMPAAVTIYSAIENTPGRIFLYIIDCGISQVDKDRLQQSLPIQRKDVTLSFLALPPESLTKSQGDAAYGRLDMFDILMVAKVLYLDADTLVRGNLRELWDMDMAGKPLAAARDISTPIGHIAVGRGLPYFNAGVLLLDLEKIRSLDAKEPIKPLAIAMCAHRSKDQDTLNKYFRGNWIEFPLTWNAQGLGTAADVPYNEDYGLLDLTEMKENPLIIHYIGSVHPPMEYVLFDEWFPFASKPWGYVGAPNHPFESEWWETLEKTAWEGIRGTKDYQDLLERKKAAAVQKGIDGFYRELSAKKAWSESHLLVPEPQTSQ